MDENYHIIGSLYRCAEREHEAGDSREEINSLLLLIARAQKALDAAAMALTAKERAAAKGKAGK